MLESLLTIYATYVIGCIEDEAMPDGPTVWLTDLLDDDYFAEDNFTQADFDAFFKRFAYETEV